MPEWYEKYKSNIPEQSDQLTEADLSSRGAWMDVISKASTPAEVPAATTGNWFDKYKTQDGKSANYNNYLAAWEAEKKAINAKKWRLTKNIYNEIIALPIHETITKLPSTFIRTKKNLKEFKEEISKPIEQIDFEKLQKNIDVDTSSNILAAEVPSPETGVELAKDIVGNVAGFVTRLALLKRAFPGANPTSLWELENIATGGRPGKGALDYLVYSAAGKAIKGKGKLKTIGRITAQSASFAGYNAIEQKLTTGEIDPSEVAVAAGIPLALGGAEALVKAGVKLRSNKITTAIVKATPEPYKAQVNATLNPDIQRVKAVRVQRKTLPPSKTKYVRSLPAPQKALPMSAEEAVTRKAGELYDGLITEYESGSKRAGQKLARLIQGQNLPTINELYERVGAGDASAAEAIQKGLYSSSPESIVLGLKEEAAKALKIPTDAIKELQIARGAKTVITPKPIPAPNWTPEPSKPKTPPAGMYEVEYFGDGKIKSVTPVPNALTPEDVPLQKEVNAATDELINWVQKAKKYRAKVAPKVLRMFRIKQAATANKILEQELKNEGGDAWEAIGKSKAGLKGRVDYKEFDPPELSADRWKAIRDKILEVYPKENPSVYFERLGAWTAFDKIRRGIVPRNNEFEKIANIIGEEATQKLWLGIQQGRPFSWFELPKLAIAMFKTKFGFDNQTARQASSVKYKHPALYTKGVVMNERARWSNNYAEKADASLKASPNYADSAKYVNYVGERGFRSGRLEYYGMGFTERLLTAKFKNKFLDKQFGQALRDYGRLLEANERGASAGINSVMKGMWDLYMSDLGRMKGLSSKDVINFKKNRGKTINTFLKILNVKTLDATKETKQILREIQSAANYFVFSPSMTVSRPLSIKALLANKGSRAYAADILARNVAGNHLTSMAFAAIGNYLRTKNPTQEPIIDGDANPLSGKWGKGKIGGVWYDNSGGDAPFYRTLARVFASAYATGRELTTGEKTTELGGTYIPNAGETISNYIETRETAMLGFAKTMLTGKDWIDKPIPRFEATLRALSPEVIEAMYDAGRADGLWSMLLAGSAAAGSVGTGVYEPLASATRKKYRDIRANQEYSLDWNDLAPSQQRALEGKYYSEFKELDERVSLESKKNPPNLGRMIEQQQEGGEAIIKRLDPDNILKLGDKTIELSRRPKDFYLNDRRYNEYIKQTAQELDRLLSTYNVDAPNEKVIDSFIDTAKKIAYTKVQAAIETKRL